MKYIVRQVPSLREFHCDDMERAVGQALTFLWNGAGRIVIELPITDKIRLDLATVTQDIKSLQKYVMMRNLDKLPSRDQEILERAF